MIRVFESFSGMGSQRMALKNIGVEFEVVGISEVDKFGLLAYDAIHHNNEPVEIKTKEEMIEEIKSKNIAYNFSTGKSQIPRKEEDLRKLYNAHIRSKNYGDIRLIDAETLPDFDLFTYSFPCKNISSAGRQAGLDEGSNTQSSLLWECRRIIQTKKPKYLLMENVKNLVGKKHKPNFDKWCEELEEMGYTNYWDVLNGKNFGVPQNRERVMMVSILNDEKKDYVLPKNNGKPITCTRDILEKDGDFKYFTKDFQFTKSLPTTKTGEIEIIAMSYWTSYIEEQRIQSELGVSSTLKAVDGASSIKVYLHDTGKIRYLTQLECWRLMGYTDEQFNKVKALGFPKYAMYERAGRGIVVPMLEEIFRNLFL